MAYGIAGPFANRIKQVVDEEGEMYKMVMQLIVANLHGHPMPLVIEIHGGAWTRNNRHTNVIIHRHLAARGIDITALTGGLS